MSRPPALLLAFACFAAGGAPGVIAVPPTLTANSNVAPAGTLHDGVLTLELETKPARWHRNGGAVPGSAVDAFAERGKAPLVPGPLVRVPAGTEIRARVHNMLARPITFFLPKGEGIDSVLVPPGATREIRERAMTPGNYLYRATTDSKASEQMAMDGVLAGALIVDTAGLAHPPRDRVLMLLMTPDSAMEAGANDSTDVLDVPGITAFTINGRSWPNTERLSATVGDTVRWRVINASAHVHPMHLHGFYFRVDDFAGPLVTREGQGAPGRMVVTERMSNFSRMSMTWVPERAGNWLFHCHFALHLAPPTSPPGIPTLQARPQQDHVNHALTGMVGLVMGITVAPRSGDHAVAEAKPQRRLRLVAVRDTTFPDTAPAMHFVLEENGRRTSAGSTFSPSIYLTRDEPVSITIVNRMREATAVHWHGMELQSYYDGVAGLSGSARRLAPVIAPGDSFEARFTPPRAGTFMYHSHVDDVRQQTAGLVGALIVLDGPPAARPDDHEVFIKGSREALFSNLPLEINGNLDPDTIVIRVGRPARFRIMSLALVNPNATVHLTARPDSAFQSRLDTMLVRWLPVAKDGADLPAAARTLRLARQLVSMGETYDFEYTPARSGALRIEVRTGGGALLNRVAVRVE